MARFPLLRPLALLVPLIVILSSLLLLQLCLQRLAVLVPPLRLLLAMVAPTFPMTVSWTLFPYPVFIVAYKMCTFAAATVGIARCPALLGQVNLGCIFGNWCQT